MMQIFKKLLENPLLALIALVITIITGIITILIFVSGIDNLPNLYRRWFLPDLYDNFNDSRYDGKLNPGLWQIEGTQRGEATQLNGTLVIQSNNIEQGGNFAVNLTNPSNISYQNFRFMEAKFKLDSREAGKGSFLKIQAVTVVGKNAWWIECKFTNQTTAYPVISCNLQEGNFLSDGSPIYVYETEETPFSYDTWYRIRFDSDSSSGKVHFYVDERLIGSSSFSDTSILRNFNTFLLQVGSWIDPEQSILGYVDDVSVGYNK